MDTNEEVLGVLVIILKYILLIVYRMRSKYNVFSVEYFFLKQFVKTIFFKLNK